MFKDKKIERKKIEKKELFEVKLKSNNIRYD